MLASASSRFFHRIGAARVNDEQAHVELTVPADAENIPLVRHAVAGFLGGDDPLSDLISSDVLLAVTEACTNVVQHAYRDVSEPDAEIEISAERSLSELTISVRDRGRGFAPRVDSPGLGLGLPVIAALTHNVEIRPFPPSGTEVVMTFLLDDGSHALEQRATSRPPRRTDAGT